MSGKIPDYSFRFVPSSVSDFKDAVRDVVNNGTLQFPVGTAVPTHKANAGQLYYRVNSTSVAMYMAYTQNTWILLISV